MDDLGVVVGPEGEGVRLFVKLKITILDPFPIPDISKLSVLSVLRG